MRVVIGEDEALLREGLALLLRRLDFDVVAAARDGDELVRAALQHEAELVVTDIRMPPDFADEGLRAALEIRAARPSTAVVVLSQHVQRRYAEELLAQQTAGVGYLLKQRVSDSEAFAGDLRRVCAGGTALDPEVVATLVRRARRGDGAGEGIERLTARQLDVLALIAEGCSNAAIASRLGTSERAVVKQASRVYELLGLDQSGDSHRRVLAAIRYLAG